MKKQIQFLVLILSPTFLFAQSTFSAGNYSQNFGTSTVAAWTDNTTFTGWYALSYQITTLGTDPFQGTINITGAIPPNAGGWAVYQCNGGTDMKLGTRPSNNSGGPDNPGLDGRRGIGLGLCLNNNFGLPIVSISVDFDWYQLSLAENGNFSNQNFLSYFVSSSNLVGTDLPNNAHAYTNVAGGNYAAPNNNATAGSNQTNSYPCTVTGHISVCIPINVPIGNYIMLRWWDPNNSANDPHMAIDNISVTAYSDNVCTTILPVELLDFAGNQNGENIKLNWSTASETNNHFFTVERAGEDGIFYGIGTVQGNGNSSTTHFYSFIDENPNIGINYYRLTQTDFNGQSKTYSPIFVQMGNTIDHFTAETWNCDAGICYSISGWNDPIILDVFDGMGKLLLSRKIGADENGNIPLVEDTHGIFFLRFYTEHFQEIKKVLR